MLWHGDRHRDRDEVQSGLAVRAARGPAARPRRGKRSPTTGAAIVESRPGFPTWRCTAMAMKRKESSTRKPPEPSDSHAEIDDWMRRAMPDLNPIVARLDELIRTTHSGLHFGLKWK